VNKAKGLALVEALDQEFGWSRADNADDGTGYPWRDRTDPFFTPQPLSKFLYDELGITLFPLQLKDLSELLGDDPKLVFESRSDSPQQGIFCYGKGGGKDFMVSCVMVWVVHLLLCLKNPAVYLGQAPDENIDILTVAYSLDQAKSVLFFKMKQRIKKCGWLKGAIARLVPDIHPDRYFKDGNGYVGSECILFPGNIRLWSVPATDAAEGKNPILWAADEIAAFASPVRVNQAQHIHRLLVSSSRTRFGDRWRGFLISFPRHKADYLMQQIRLCRKGNAPDTYAVVRPTWEVNPMVTRASLQVDFDRDPEGSECRYACNPPAAIDAYFKSPELLFLHATGAPIDFLRQHLMDLDEEVLEAIAVLAQSPVTDTNQHGDAHLDRRGFPKLAAWVRGGFDLEGYPYEYHVHVDVGIKGDGCGFAMGHLERRSDGTVQPVLDLACRWTGKMFRDFGEIHRQSWFADTLDQSEIITAAEVDLRTVREFIFFLRYARGFNFAIVTFDGFNSAESIQELRKRDIPVGLHTVDKVDYDEYKAQVYNRNLRYFGFPVLLEESLKLQIRNGEKVEAPRTTEGDGDGLDSHKDISDCVAAICGRMARSKDESVQFYQAPPIEEIWDRRSLQDEQGLLRVDMRPEEYNAVQKQIQQRFFDED